MKIKTLKTVKISTLVFIAAMAGTLPATSMAHDNGQTQVDVLLHLLPLLSTQHVHEHNYIYEHDYRHHRPHKVKHFHKHPRRGYGYDRGYHQGPVVRSYERYSDNKIIKKHFK